MLFLTGQDLDKILIEGLTKAPLVDVKAANTFNLLYSTGIRLAEVNVDLWVKSDDDKYILSPKKYNKVRIFEADELPELWKDCIRLEVMDCYCRPHETIKRRIKEVWSNGYFYSKTKQIRSHIFRHNYAKKVFEEKQTNEAVQAELGEKHLTSAMNYIYSQIEYVPFGQLPIAPYLPSS